MTKIAFVTPWYGKISGGMESETRQTAERLAARGWPVEVLTTCIRDFFSDWSVNHYPVGVSEENGVTVRRFAVNKRNQAAFDEVNGRLMFNQKITAAQAKIYMEEMFKAPELYRYMAAHQQAYIFFFIPYMFATTYYGGQIAPQRSVIIPCLHDESYAYLPLYKEVLPHARALILHTEAERLLAEKIFGPAEEQCRLLWGEGVETGFTADAARFREKYGLGQTPFLLYAGRKVQGKNVPLLLEYWSRYKQEYPQSGKLVLIGPGEPLVPDTRQADVLDLGFVPLQDKYDAHAAAVATCQPSLNESFSIVIMESWVAERPVLVHGRCAVTKEHCLKSNGGLYFSNYPEFAGTVNYLFSQQDIADQMGVNGRAYVLDNFAWDVILDKYEALLKQLLAQVA